MRPCTCDNFRPGSTYTTDQCARCWLYHENPTARAWFDADGNPEAQAAILDSIDPYRNHTGPRPDAPPCRGCLGQEEH
jgi:hypothetical protein